MATIDPLSISNSFMIGKKISVLLRLETVVYYYLQIHINYGLVSSRQGSSHNKALTAEEFIQ